MGFAFWRMCDFQIHTPRDPNWAGPRPIGMGEDLHGSPATEADVAAERRQWAEGFVEACAARGLEAIGITDHHEMVMVPYVQQAIEDRRRRDPRFDIWLFPGMELTARHGVQCLLLFDAHLPEQWRQEALSRLGIVVANISPNVAQAQKVVQLDLDYPDIGPELDKVDELKGRYIVLPNVSNGGKYTALTNGAHADVVVVVARTDVDYRRPILFRPKPYDCWSRIERVGTRSLTLRSEIRDGEELLAAALVTIVFVDPETGRSTEPPEVYRQPLLAARAAADREARR